MLGQVLLVFHYLQIAIITLFNGILSCYGCKNKICKSEFIYHYFIIFILQHKGTHKHSNSTRKCHKRTLIYSGIRNYRFVSDSISSVIMKYKMFMLFGYLWTFVSYLPQIIFPTGNGNWGTWGSWNPCAVTCGAGTRTRYRQCNGGSCSESFSETTSCFIAQCPGRC